MFSLAGQLGSDYPTPLPGTSVDLKWNILYLIAGDVLDTLVAA
jgi:hypothetical protein